MQYPHKGVDTIRTKQHRTLIDILVATRKRRKVSQVQLARKLKHSQTWVARVESGGRRIDVVEFLRLTDALGLDPAKIIRAMRNAGNENNRT